MKTPTRRQAWFFLILALCLAVAASAAGLVISRQGGSQAQAAVPGSASTRADLGTMQAALNSGSASKQAALLVPPLKFAPGSGPIVPPGETITILPGTLRPSGQRATVQAAISGKGTVTLGLLAVQGHWRLYAAGTGTAKTRAAVAGQPASARLMADMISAGQSAAEAGTYQGVILVHGFGERASNWDSSGMTARLRAIPGVRVLKFDYSQVNTQWVSNPAIGPALADYIHAVAKASGRPVIVVGFSMGGLATRYAATTGARAGDIAMVITIGTPNTGSLLGNAHDALCGAAGAGIELAWHGACTQFQAASAMAVFNPEIMTLPRLPPSVPLHAIAGDETYVFKLLGAQVAWPFFGDGVVTTGSALDKRPGWKDDTFDTVANPFVLDDTSAFHLRLTSNPNVQVLVDRYISDYLRGHPVPAAQGQQPASGHPAGPDGEDPLNVVYNYYDTLNAHDYQRAWELGGNNIAAQNGQTYDSWVAGYGSTKSLYITGQDAGVGLGNHLVRVSITVTQKDGSRQYYAGTYTVRQTDYQSWTITAADIHSTSGPASSSPQLGGTAYWLADGGRWFVHDYQLQITQGPSGLTGKESWNAGPCDWQNINDTVAGHCWGSDELTFTSQPDGSLEGTVISVPVYTSSAGSLPAGYQPEPGEPYQGQVIRLVPVAPMLAKFIQVIPDKSGNGNSNLCQQGLPSATETKYCGA